VVVAKGQVTRMQAAYVGVGEVREVVARLRAGTRPLLLEATGTDGASGNGRGLAARLAARLRLVK
jgi:hypothetical protein